MTRHKSHVPTPQSPGGFRPSGELHNCENEYCKYSTRSLEEYSKHLENCQYRPFSISNVRKESGAVNSDNGMKHPLPSEKNDQEITGSAHQIEKDGSITGDYAASSSSLSDPPPSNFSDIEIELGREAREADSFRDDTVRPYVNPKSAFTYYESVKETKSKHSPALQALDEAEASANGSPTPADEAPDSDSPSMPPTPKVPKNADIAGSGRHGFPEFTDVKNFEEYLMGAPEMPYDVLYHKTSVVTQTMMTYQGEWDTLDKEIRNWEESERLKALTAAERAKAAADEKQADEDLILAELENTYRDELKLSRKPWIEEFSAQFIEDHPDEQATLDQLNKLRDSVFFKAFQKRQRALNDNHPDQLVDKPLPDPKQTKEERDLEARKRRHLTDRITFDDMNQADAYGFTYLPSDLAKGNQLPYVPSLRVVGMPRGMKPSSRPNRNATKGFVAESGENSDVPSAAEDELPQKRSRAKPKKLEDDANDISSAAENSKGTGSAKTYLGEDGIRRYIGSNKPSGRPAASGKSAASRAITKSKLDQMSLAASEQAEQSNGIENDENYDDLDGELSNGQVLASDQANELQQAAESLVNQTSPVEKRKRGGRPKKEALPAQSHEMEHIPESVPKPKGKVGRKRKVDTLPQPSAKAEMGDLPAVPRVKGKPGRKKRVRDEDAGIEDEVENEPTAKRAKSEASTTQFIQSTKKQAVNGAFKPHQGSLLNDDDPLASIELQPQTAQSSRPTTSSSKEAPSGKRLSRAGSPASSKPPMFVAKPKTNGKRHRNDSDDEVTTGGGNTADTSKYNSEAEDEAHVPKRVKTSTIISKPRVNGKLKHKDANGELQSGADEFIEAPKMLKMKAGIKRKRGAEDEGITGADNTPDATNNNSDAEDGARASKKSKKSREKTDAEKASQSAAMKNKWADQNGKMRQGIERRKRRDVRKRFEKNRVAKGAEENPDLIYKSDQEGFSYEYFNETPPVPAAAAPTPAPAQPIQEEEVEEEILIPEEEPEKIALTIAIPKSTPTLALTTTRSGRQSKPSRKVNSFGMDGVDDDSEDDYERPVAHTQKSESAYEEFQKLTSPGHQLGKRMSKPLYNLDYGTTSDEEDF